MSLILFFAFQGGECALCVGGEVKNPNQTIPKGILFGILTVLILYILIQTVSQGVLGDELPNFKENTLSVVAENIFGPIGFTVLTIGAAVSMYGTLSSEVLSIPRIFFRASRDHILPFRQLTKVHPKFHTPYISILLYAVLGFIFASLGGFKQLAIFSSAGTLLVYLGVSLSVIKLRLKNINPTEKTFKIRGGYTIPILSILIIGLLLSNLSQKEIIGILIFIAVLSVIYFVRKKVIRK